MYNRWGNRLGPEVQRGTPPKDKRLAVFAGGHGVFDKWSEVMREILDWLDRYLGRVHTR